MINPLSAAEYFIVRAYESKADADMTNMKLQKLLYYAQSLHLALLDEPLFEEEIQAWRYGPVCPPAYYYYNDYESKQLPIPTGENFSEISEESKSLLEEVWENFGTYTAPQLRDMTHEESPWQIARGNLAKAASSQKPIALDEMKKLGLSKLSEIEETHPEYGPMIESALEPALVSAESTNKEETQGVRDWLESLLD